MPLASPDIYDRLVALRSSLIQDSWASSVQRPVVSVFNKLAVSAAKLQPDDPILRSIEPVTAEIKPGTLCALIDQILIALDE